MNKTRCALCLSALLLTAALSGCGDEPVQPEVTVPSTGETINIAISATSDEAPQPTEPTEIPETVPVPEFGPVTRLSSIKWRTVPQLMDLGNGLVLACRNYYEPEKGILNFLDVVNVYDDTVVLQKTNNTPKDLVQQRFQDGHFILSDSLTNTFYVYDQNLNVTQEFNAPNVEGYFSPDRQNYYYIDCNVLYRMDVASGNRGRMTLDQDLRLESLIGSHSEQNILVARFYRSFYNDTWGTCAIDCSSGKILILNENVSHLWFDGDTFYAAMTSDHVYGNDICYGDLSSGVKQKATALTLGSDTVSYTMLPGSGYMVLRTVDDNNLSTTIYDLAQNGISSRLSQYDHNTSTLGTIYLEHGQLILGVYPDAYDYSPVIINPGALSYEKSLSINKESWSALVDKTAAQRYQKEAQGPVVPVELRALRVQADMLEKKYGVQILMGDQTLDLCISYAAVQSDPQMIANALNTLDQALALYPQGFFKQFQNTIGEGGVYFCLTGSIQGSLNPVGKTVKVKNRYEVLLDIGAQNIDQTIHHELWHAIEMKLSTDSFEHPQWHSLNPQGFLYYGHYDSGYRNMTQWTYEQRGTECYFVDSYAQINAREDRARIMEYVMSADASDLLRSSPLRKKLEIMSQTIRDKFDTTGWQTPYWERYL